MTKVKKPRILLVEDEQSFQDEIRLAFGKVYNILNARSVKAALLAIKLQEIDLVILDLFLDSNTKLDGLDLIKPFKQEKPTVPIIICSKDPSSATIVKALKLGADDYIRKDEFDAESSKILTDKYLNRSPEKVTAKVIKEDRPTSFFIGESPQILKIKKYLSKLSEKPNITVLLTGESGVGKEVAARYLHEYGIRKDKPFEAVHLSNLTETLMESRLFGHKKGAFTDAKEDMKGALEKAHKGILFLDEIGEINGNIQTKLLRFIEDKIVNPIGGDAKQLDVQIIVATNKNLKKEVRAGHFRKDLYYRLNQFPIEIPPLRERREDLPEMIRYYFNKEGVNMDDLTPLVIKKMNEYSYPGNIRELVNTIKSVSAKYEVLELDEIDESLLPREFIHPEEIFDSVFANDDTNTVATTPDENQPLDKDATIASLHLKEIEDALVAHGGKKGKAAASLELSMDNLRYRVDKYYDSYPHLFRAYPMICKRYKKAVMS